MPSPQKAKGSSFEREVSRFLSDLYGESFIRAPGSGAYVGGSNQSRKQILHEGQIRSFKGDIVPGQSFSKLNAECKSYKDFPFHLLLTGENKQFDQWLSQLLDVSDEGDLNVLFMKFNRIGRYIAVEPKHTWVMDNYTFYHSLNYGDWLITEFDSFFKNNKHFFAAYSGSHDTKSNTKILTINTEPETI